MTLVNQIYAKRQPKRRRLDFVGFYLSNEGLSCSKAHDFGGPDLRWVVPAERQRLGFVGACLHNVGFGHIMCLL